VTEKTKVLLADPHEIFLEGLKRLVNEQEDLICVAALLDCKSLSKALPDFLPDVAIIDSCICNSMPELITSLKSNSNGTRFIVLTHSTDVTEIRRCFQAGVDGYLTKNLTQLNLMNAVRAVCVGDQVLCPVARICISHLIAGKDEEVSEAPSLSQRELEVIAMAGKGMTNGEIATELNIAKHTVASHLLAVFRKLEVKSRTQAVLQCLQRGWISTDNA